VIAALNNSISDVQSMTTSCAATAHVADVAHRTTSVYQV